MRTLSLTIFLFLLAQISLGQRSPYKFSDQIVSDFTKDTSLGKCDYAAWNLSYIGEYKQMLKMVDTSEYFDPVLKQYPELRIKSSSLSEKDSLYFSQFMPKSALEYISTKVKAEKIVIINEAHHQPMHRVFTESLLQVLYDNGFRYFGIETLDYIDSTLNQRKYPVLNSGYYSVEPQFGNLIRKALEIGFYVFPYETIDNMDGKQREINQANNINKILQKDSTAKILIHCGFGHAVESYYRAWEYAMAGRLKQFTGIDPLTIDQVDLTESSLAKFDNPYFKQIHLDYDAVFVDSSGHTFCGAKGNNKFDIQVYHPRTKWIHERPIWVFYNKKIPTPIVSMITLTFPCLVFAYKENDDINNAVPIDIIELKSKNDNKYLSLYKGNYLLVIKDEQGQEQKIIIKI